MSGRCLWQCARQGRQFQQAFDQQQQQWAANQGGWVYPNYASEYVEQCTSSPYPVYDTPPYYQQAGWFPEYQSYPFQQYSQPMPYLPCYQQQSPTLLYDQGAQQDWQSNGSSPAVSEWGKLDRCDHDLSTTSHFNRWLTKRITETSTPKELLQLIQQKGRYFDKVHLAAGYVQAASCLFCRFCNGFSLIIVNGKSKRLRTKVKKIKTAKKQKEKSNRNLQKENTKELKPLREGWRNDCNFSKVGC
eukprot:TRINITY_DN3596_c0_g2_i7.p2 TRINITY_DN3596_c0_g2~~TRINITY_DN3596_c0_g2_i7.p2  ORF type:complete len:245 (-),score=7.26 TRINITY_DN3596_c0_g2_i7:29-763(-)